MNDKEQTSPILWAGVVIIKDRKMLVLKEYDKPFLLVPGGKLEPGETDEEAAIREVSEEVGVVPSGLSHLVTIQDKSKNTGQDIRFKVFRGEIEESPEKNDLPGKTELITWIDSSPGRETGNLMEASLPILAKKGLID